MSLRLVNASIALALCVLATVFAVPPATTSAPAELPDLENLLPRSFGNWQESPLSSLIRPAEDIEDEGTVTLYRTYRNSLGQHITLVVVFGAARSDAVRLHQPDVCYRAQGYSVENHGTMRLELGGNTLPLNRLAAAQVLREDAITYWLRTGDQVRAGETGQQLAALARGFGPAPDSTLVRLSTRTATPEVFYSIHAEFIAALLAVVPAETRHLLIGEANDAV